MLYTSTMLMATRQSSSVLLSLRLTTSDDFWASIIIVINSCAKAVAFLDSGKTNSWRFSPFLCLLKIGTEMFTRRTKFIAISLCLTATVILMASNKMRSSPTDTDGFSVCSLLSKEFSSLAAFKNSQPQDFVILFVKH